MTNFKKDKNSYSRKTMVKKNIPIFVMGFLFIPRLTTKEMTNYLQWKSFLPELITPKMIVITSILVAGLRERRNK